MKLLFVVCCITLAGCASSPTSQVAVDNALMAGAYLVATCELPPDPAATQPVPCQAVPASTTADAAHDAVRVCLLRLAAVQYQRSRCGGPIQAPAAIAPAAKPVTP